MEFLPVEVRLTWGKSWVRTLDLLGCPRKLVKVSKWVTTPFPDITVAEGIITSGRAHDVGTSLVATTDPWTIATSMLRDDGRHLLIDGLHLLRSNPKS